MTRSLDTCVWMRVCAILLLILGCTVIAGATNLTGQFKNPDGSAVNGKIIFLLSQPARLNDQSAQIVPMVKIFSVTNGTLEAGAFIYGNDVLVPGGTYYLVRLVDNNNNLLFEQKWSISGVNLDLGTLTPTTSGVVYPDPLIKNITTDQSVQGPVSFAAPISVFSLTLNGNLNPGLADTYELGSSSAPWQELHAQRWNSLFAVGAASGLVTPPSVAPSVGTSSTGGSIAAGSYNICITYVNRNGETPCSPSTTVSLSGATSALVAAFEQDYGWRTGAFALRMYASNDGGVTFWRQTPTVVASDFMYDATAHYIKMGSGTQKLFQSLTFSGTQAPTTNTAVIDPLQVALNATRRVSTPTDYTPFGTVIVPAIIGGGQQLTTPLVMAPGDRMIGSGSMGSGTGSQTRIVTSTSWANDKIAAVMNFGGSAEISNVSILAQGTNGIMVLGGAGLQVGNTPLRVNDVSVAVDTNNNYSAIVGIGILYRMYFDNTFLTCGNACVQYRNASGSLHYYTGGRWDGSGDSFVRNIPGWIDPDSGTTDVSSFPNSVNQVVLKNVNMEGSHGVMFDVVNLSLALDSVDVSDAATNPGTAAQLKMGRNAAFGIGSGGSTFILRNAVLGGSANAAATIKITGTDVAIITLEGESGIGGSASSVGIDANNVFLTLTNRNPRSSLTANPNASGSAVKIINLPSNSDIALAGGSTIAGEGGKWFEITDRLVITPFNGSDTWDRSKRTSFRNDTTTTGLYKSDDTSCLFCVNNTSGDASLVRFFTIGANAPAQTDAGIGLPNAKRIWWRNAANSADLSGIYLDGSNNFYVGTDGNISGVKIGPNSNTAALKGVLTGTATLDFPNTTPSTCSDLTISMTGAADGDAVSLGTPNATVPAGGSFFAWVSAANTVTVRFCADGTARDPASGVFRVSILKF